MPLPSPREIAAIDADIARLTHELNSARKDGQNLTQHLKTCLKGEILEEMAEITGLATGKRFGGELYHAVHGGSLSGLLWATGEILMMFPGGVAKGGVKFLKRIPGIHAMLIALEKAVRLNQHKISRLEHRLEELKTKRGGHGHGHGPSIKPKKVYGHRNAKPKEDPPAGMHWKFTPQRQNIIRDSRGNIMAHHPDMGFWEAVLN